MKSPTTRVGKGGAEMASQRNISKKTFCSGRTEPASERIASALCLRSSRISRAFLPLISCVCCTRTPHFPSTVSNLLVAAPPPPHASPLYLPPYPLGYWSPAYSLRLRASGDYIFYPHTSGNLDLAASLRFRPLPSYLACFLVRTLLSFP